MDWISTAFLSATAQAGVGILDSHLLSRRKLGLLPFMLAMGILQIISGVIFSLIFPWWIDMPIISLVWITCASISGTFAAMIIFFVLQEEEVSRVVPITHISPIFVAIAATLFLGERLEYLHWLAILIVVVGAIIISMEKSVKGDGGSVKKPYLLLFLCSLLGATRSVFIKEALDYLTFWNVQALSSLMVGTIFLCISLRKRTIQAWFNAPRRNSTVVIFLSNELLALFASVLHVRAVSLGPVSLVSTIMGTRPVLVAVYSMILHLVLPGFLIRLPERRIMLIRLAAILMIVGGLSIIYLN